MIPVSFIPRSYLANKTCKTEVKGKRGKHLSRRGQERSNRFENVRIALRRIIEARRVNKCDLSPIQLKWEGALHRARARFETAPDSQPRTASKVNERCLPAPRSAHNSGIRPQHRFQRKMNDVRNSDFPFGVTLREIISQEPDLLSTKSVL